MNKSNTNPQFKKPLCCPNKYFLKNRQIPSCLNARLIIHFFTIWWAISQAIDAQYVCVGVCFLLELFKVCNEMYCLACLLAGKGHVTNQ